MLTTNRKTAVAFATALALSLSFGLSACKKELPSPPASAPGAGAPGMGLEAAPAEAAATPTEPAEELPPPGVFVWTSPEPKTIDPTMVSDLTGAVVALNLFEGLFVAAPGDGPARPAVADKWSVSQDGRTYTFWLRSDARWSDGEPVVAEDFVYAWRRMLDPATGAPGAEDLWRLHNGRAYSEGRLADPAAVGVRAVGPRILAVTLERPDPHFPLELTTSRFLPVPRRVVEAHGASWTRPEHIVTNGPLRLTEWKPRERLVFERDAGHWDAENVALKGAVLRVTESEAVAMRWYDARLVHYTPGQVPFERLVAMRDAERPDLRLDPFIGVSYLAFNVRRPPFDDPRVRQAFDLAIDKSSLVRSTLRGGQRPAQRLLPPAYREMVGYEGPGGAGFDPDAAQDLLAAAGYPGGAGFPAVKLSYNASEVLDRVMAHIARDLQKALGVRVQLEQQEWKSYLAKVRAGDFDVARFAMSGGVDPADLLNVLRSEGPNNIGGWGLPAYDELLTAARSEADADTRLAALAKAETLMVDARPILPLYFYTRPSLLSPTVKGFETQSRDIHLLRYLSL